MSVKKDESIFDIPTYIIHMKSNTDRDDALDDIKRIGFRNAQFFDAVIGKNIKPSLDFISPRVMLELEEGRTSHEGIISMGAIGCYLSHTDIWKQLIDNNIEMALIFEDDISIDNFDEIHQEILEKSELIMSKNFDITLIGVIPRCGHLNKLPRITDRYIGNHSYFITLQGAKNLLKHAFPIDMHLDAYIGLMAKLDPTIIIYGFEIIQSGSKGSSTGNSDLIGDFFPLSWLIDKDCSFKDKFIISVPKIIITVLIISFIIYLIVRTYKRRN